MKQIILAALAAMALAACGGGGGGSGTTAPAPAPVAPPPVSQLAGYVGTWVSACDGRELNSVTVTRASGSADAIVISYKSDYYANLNCTGNVVATWTQSADATAVYAGSVDSSIVFTPGASPTPARVDKVTATLPAHTQSVVGPNVTHTVQFGQPQWCISFGDGTSTCVHDRGAQPAQTVDGGLYLRGNEMFELSPSGSTYVVNERFTRK